MYLIFIGPLSDPYYQHIYQYPKCTQYLLWMLWIMLIVIVIAANIVSTLELIGIVYSQSVAIVIGIVYVVTDCTMSILITLLFFRPICCCFSEIAEHVTSPNVDLSVAKKYGIIAFLQLISSVTYQLSLFGAIYLAMIDSPHNVRNSYFYIRSVILMVDCLLLMICIYIGFARKQTVYELIHFKGLCISYVLMFLC